MTKHQNIRQENNKAADWISSINWDQIYTPTLRISLHLILWAFLTLNYYLAYSRFDPNPAIVFSLVFKDLFTVITSFYFIAYYIFPKALFKGKFLTTFLWMAVVYFWWLIVTYLTIKYISTHFTMSTRMTLYAQSVLDGGIKSIFLPKKIVYTLIDATYIFMPPLSIKLIKSIFSLSTRSIALERDNLNLEINFLKSQINPHFLFNSLNNIYTLSIKSDQRASTLILHLSDLIRYTLYESEAEKVLLSRELSFLEDFIELERVRYGNNVTINFRIEGEVEDQPIVPLVLFPFIENAFKHGADASIGPAWVSIFLKIEEKTLLFEVANSVGKGVVKNEFNGVGINNVKKRLQLHYANNYNLNIEPSESQYKITLLINI